MATAPLVNRAKDSIPKVKAAYEALADTLKKLTSPRRIDMEVRRAIEAGKLDAVLRCVQKPQRSKITFRTPGVLSHTVHALRRGPQADNWSESSIVASLRRTKAIAVLLESERSGFGALPFHSSKDLRKAPELLGTYLELAAVDASRYAKEDVTAVKTTAERLLTLFEKKAVPQNTVWEAPQKGQVNVVLDNLPIWSGLVVASKLLGKDMPHAALAKSIIESYGNGLKSVVEQLKSQEAKEDSYAGEAIRAYESSPALQ